MEGIILLILGVPLVTAIWLIVRAIDAKSKINDLSLRLHQVEGEIISLRKPKLAPAKTPAPATPGPTPVQPVPISVQPVVPPPAPVPLVEKVIPAIAPPAPPVVQVFQQAALPAPVSPPIWSTPVTPEPPVAAPDEVGGLPEPAQGSFEMRLGTYWLVRIGVVMLLTALVFFGNYARENFVGKLGPGGKISLLYLASAALMGAGLWWQRRAEKDSMRSYAEVLFAGGLAAVYFTTYAAHHLVQLCVIASPTLDGILLLAWAGFMGWIADRKKSEVLAVFALGLAYYSSIITNVGAFTLYSNLLLTVAGIYFLMRNRWVGLSFGSLFATYGGYAFWRFYHGGDWLWAAPPSGLWLGASFLMGYWALFTVAAFLSRSDKLSGAMRACFMTLNNGALFTLFVLTMLQEHSGGFWKFSLVYGVVLLGVCVLARRWLTAEPLVADTYLTQGLLLITLGLVAKYSGLHLALMLGFESSVLLTLGTLQKSRVQVVGAYLSAALAVICGCINMQDPAGGGVWSGAALGTFMLVNAIWCHRRREEREGCPFRPETGCFTLLALTIWFTTTWFNATADHFTVLLALEAGALTCSIYILGLPELALAGQAFLVYGQIDWLGRAAVLNVTCPWWQPALIIIISLGLAHWWQHQKILKIGSVLGTPAGMFLQMLFSLALVSTLYLWLQPLVDAPDWLALTSVLAAVVTLYGVWARAWLLAATGQLLLVASGVQFVLQLANGKPDWYFPLAPVAALGLFSLATVCWFSETSRCDSVWRTPLLKLARVYRWVALILSIWWLNVYVPERERMWVFMALGLGLFLLGGWRKNLETLGFGAALSFVGFVLLWLPQPASEMVYLPNLLALLAWLVQQQIARRRAAEYPIEPAIHAAAILAGCASLWWFLTRAILDYSGGFYLASTWAALALVLFLGGMVLGERMYRWAALGVLSFALGKVVLVDVWKQETIYRILTFMALGLVLLILGYIYNKYQEKIRLWL